MEDHVQSSTRQSPRAGSSASLDQHERSSRERRKLEPRELARWVEQRRGVLSEWWLDELRGRDGRWSPSVWGLMEMFIEQAVAFLPALLGPYRHQIEPLWQQSAELYGSVAAKRGLAAGEVIEEFQILREGIIRLLFTDPPFSEASLLSLRDMLRLNRIVDRGVTQANVGHTDALFFALFQGSGVPESLTPELVDEVREQLALLREEFDELMAELRH